MSNPLSDVQNEIKKTEMKLESLHELEKKLGVFYGVESSAVHSREKAPGEHKKYAPKGLMFFKIAEIINGEKGATFSRLKYALLMAQKGPHKMNEGTLSSAISRSTAEGLMEQRSGKGSHYDITEKGMAEYEKLKTLFSDSPFLKVEIGGTDASA